ncbi:predicted protein [Nematostella vectensis]|uniref:Uncharacterized protein n=1 Tax=Nematostella vectensis TaxID=45351 RepID=A7S646_NEMVE|nr:predicted protein [Nematostella vectensis]|eukprot:XP_001632857.1 predicted protein [Nematostella vectensis]
MGDCADDILATLKVDESKASYSEMKTALETYFGARRNIFVDRVRDSTGEFRSQATLKYRQSKTQERIYVIRNQSCSLLSKKVCVDLGLVKLDAVREVLQSPQDFRKEFPKLFQGKQQLTADALSRAPVGKPLPEDVMLVEEVKSYVGIGKVGWPRTCSWWGTSAQKDDGKKPLHQHKDYLVAFCVQNKITQPGVKETNKAFTQQVTYARTKLKIQGAAVNPE